MNQLDFDDLFWKMADLESIYFGIIKENVNDVVYVKWFLNGKWIVGFWKWFVIFVRLLE